MESTDVMIAVPPRTRRIEALGSSAFDLLVVGGGITGAGVARDAARRGFRTALVERDDFASGTSSRSSRLVHGGVRYLEHGWFHLVFEASRERRRLLDNAPHLVRPLQFTWPVYEDHRVARWELGAGLLLYDVLALYRNVGKHRRLSADDVLERERGLSTDGLAGGALYWDAATDDARITLATVLDAEAAGAVVANHAEAIAFTRGGDRITGAVVRDRLTGRSVAVQARVIVNAAGPWSDAVRALEDPDAQPGVLGTKGVHLLVPRERVRNEGALTLLHPDDQRVMFILPAGRHAVIGTTDTRTTATPDEVRANEADVAYLLRAVNYYLPQSALTRDDVVTAWAGIRPLAATKPGTAPSSQSREHEIDVGPGGMVSVTGGKLTTFRAMAQEIVDVVADALGASAAKSDTARARYPGGDIESVDDEVSAAHDVCTDRRIAERLVHAYGSQWREVWAIGDEDAALRERIAPTCDSIRAELAYAVRVEHAATLGDALIRRTHVAFETRDHGRACATDAASVMARDLGWGDREASAAIDAYEQEVARLFTIEPAEA